MARAGPVGELVNVGVEIARPVAVAVIVGVGDGAPVELAVAVGTNGVDEALVTPITAGVGVKMDGVKVAGKKGVGPGWITQPPQADRNIMHNTLGKTLLMLSFLL